MGHTRSRTHGRLAPDRAVRELRTGLPRAVARTASAIQAEVSAYAGPIRGERRALIETAVGAGLREFSDHASGKARPDVGVTQLFRNLGWSEGVAGQSLEAMRSAFDVATRETWSELHRIAREQGLTASVLGRLGDALFENADHLRGEVEIGHRAGRDEATTGAALARDQLTQHLLSGEVPVDLGWLAVQAGWPLPHRALVLCADLPERTAGLESALSENGALVLVDAQHVLVVCDAGERQRAVTEVRRVLGPGSIALSAPVPSRYLVEAVQLVKRAHHLVELQVIPRAEIVDCADHETTLWLHAEPLLRERMVERLLAPLEAQTPHRRNMLAMTMLLWLEQRGSASSLGEQLGVHPQTIRYRLRQLDAMFDHRLNDPSLAFPMLLALKATLPLWLSPPPSSRQSRVKEASSSSSRSSGSAPANAAKRPPGH